MRQFCLLNRAFTLVEVLGAIAIIATITAVSIVSVKDTLAASQRSAVQKELQGLNTALNNFKAAGGVIDTGASVSQALSALQSGASLGGVSNYAPLSSLPELSKTIAGVPYSLTYDPETGFSYVPSGETVGDVFAGAGSTEGFGANGVTYPFDISNPEALAQAITGFAGMGPSNPEYNSYLEAFAAAENMGYLSDTDLDILTPILNSKGVYNTGSKWVAPTFDVSNPTEALAAAAALSCLRSDMAGYAAAIDSLNASLMVLAGADKSAVNTAMVNEFLTAAGMGSTRPEAFVNVDWSQLNLEGADLTNKNLSDLNISGSQLAKVSNFTGTNLSNVDLTGIGTGKNYTGVYGRS